MDLAMAAKVPLGVFRNAILRSSYLLSGHPRQFLNLWNV